jgi:hypothetical protein
MNEDGSWKIEDRKCKSQNAKGKTVLNLIIGTEVDHNEEFYRRKLGR